MQRAPIYTYMFYLDYFEFSKIKHFFFPLGTGNKNNAPPPFARSNMIRQEAEDEAAAEEDGFVGDDEAIANLFMASQPTPPNEALSKIKGLISL